MLFTELFKGRDMCNVCGQTPCNCTHITEGEVVPFKRPQPQALTWEQLPKDVLVLANDWYWAEQDNSGVDALMDPDGFGNGTANELQYITAKLQQRGWNIDYNDENDAPGEFNLKLTNKRGQTVLLSIEDAQDFTGWAADTHPQGMAEEKVRLDPKCWKGKKIGNPKTKMKGGVRVNNCVPAESIAEGTGNIGRAIKSLYQKIYRAGDDEIEYFYNDSPIFAQYWDEYEGDLDSIIAEVDPAELAVIKAELDSYVQDAGLMEVSDATLTSYLTKVDADSQKHEKDPTKRSAEKRNKSVAGFSRAFNKLDARKEKTDEGQMLENDLAQQMLALAKKINPNARLAGTPAQERERTQQMLAQRAKDRDNQPGPEPVSDEERTRLELQLKDLESKFDPNYEYSDDHTFWTKQRDLARAIASIKQRLAVKETADHDTLSGTNDIVESLRRLREADPAYTGIDPVVRSRMGMPPATQDEIRTHLDTNPPVVRSGSGAPVTTGTGSAVQSGGAVDVARAADAASPDRAMATAKPPGTTTASAPSAPSAPPAPSAPAAVTKPVATPAPAAPKPIPQVSAATTPAPSFSKGVTDIAAANKIADPNKINVGQTIKLPSGQNYTVAKGDTLSGIAAGQYKGATTPPKPAAPAPVKPAATSVPNTTGLLGKVAPSLNLPNAGMNTPPKTATTPANTTGLLGKIAPSLNQPNAGMNTPAKTAATPTPAAPTSTPAAKNIYVPNVSGAGQKGPTVAAATGADATNPINKTPYGTGNSAPPPVMFNRMAPGTLGAVTKENSDIARIKNLAGLK